LLREAESLGCDQRVSHEIRFSIWSVHTSAIRKLCRSHYTPEEIDIWSSFFKPEMYEEAIASREFLVAEEDGIVAGFGSLNKQTQEIV
jgi:hypothetical protein